LLLGAIELSIKFFKLKIETRVKAFKGLLINKTLNNQVKLLGENQN